VQLPRAFGIDTSRSGQALAGHLVEVLGDALHLHNALQLRLDEVLAFCVQLAPLGESPRDACSHTSVDAVHLQKLQL